RDALHDAGPHAGVGHRPAARPYGQRLIDCGDASAIVTGSPPSGAHMDMRNEAMPRVLRFGRFALVPHRRELLHDGVPVEIGSRAYDLLQALLAGHGRVISNEELLNRVWPGRVVEENSLHAQVAALRRALGQERHLIRTVSGRGYQLAAEVQAGDPEPGEPGRRPRVATNLPERISELIGRDAERDEVSALVAQHRLVSL